jgi:hypothetical protein
MRRIILSPAEYNAMIAADLLMAKSTASRLYQITLNPVLMDVSYMKRLPASWGTWYALSKLKPERLQSFIEDGKVNPDMEWWQAQALLTSEPDYRPKRRTASPRRSDPSASVGSTDESNTGEDDDAATSNTGSDESEGSGAEPDAEQIALAGEDALDTLKEALARTRSPIEDVRLRGDVTTCAMVARELIEHALAVLTLGEELVARADTDSQSEEPAAEQGSQSDAGPLPTLTATQQEQVQAACATLSARDAFLQDLAVELARCQQPITDEDLRIAIDGLLWAEP